ncbi:MAG TPA: Eco57I restriction-modification methylase domain-containing protein [Caulobacterales bacterium]|nr:Eco57I restriction-modification methylase domain-containing protein [Caulobacterales bacterium]
MPAKLVTTAIGSAVPASATATKSALGQFMTSPAVADFMAGMFPPAKLRSLSLLDAGAGKGVLTRTFLARVQQGDFGVKRASVSAYELDVQMLESLRRNLQREPSNKVKIVSGDFIERAVHEIKHGESPLHSHAILNPPYKKIGSKSHHRKLLREVGIETVNLYSAFVGLSVLLLKQEGYLCAIIPRSFCNGPYYRPFRELLFSKGAIRRIHLFGSRSEAFSDDDVLQENVIILFQRGVRPTEVEVSFSSDSTFFDLRSSRALFNTVVRPNDPERMIHIPETADAFPAKFDSSLAQLKIQVSTGPIVDFRLKQHLRKAPDSSTVPLLYPGHFGPNGLRWPYGNPKKPSAIVGNDETEKWLYPNGNYTVVRRFSSKEERRRIVANVVAEENIPSDKIGFENHLNVFHRGRHGLAKYLAIGLMVYLNSSVIDTCFRSFNGHTQVNATDLKALLYPNEERLMRMGKWAATKPALSQSMIDDYLRRMK